MGIAFVDGSGRTLCAYPRIGLAASFVEISVLLSVRIGVAELARGLIRAKRRMMLRKSHATESPESAVHESGWPLLAPLP